MTEQTRVRVTTDTNPNVQMSRIPARQVFTAPTEPEPALVPAPAEGEPDEEEDEEGAPVAPDASFSLSQLTGLVASRLADGRFTRHPLSRFGSLAAYALEAHRNAGRQGADNQEFAIINQITTNNPGVVPPGWVSEVVGIIDNGRPAIAALGTRALPPTGMDVNWPYFDGDLSALVTAQATEKTEIASVRVDLKKGTKAIATYSGGSDVSYQLRLRSDPEYVEQYLRIMYASYAVVTDKAFVTGLYAAAGASVVLPAGATAAQLQAALFEGSAKVQAATGSPASAVIVSSDMFIAFGKLAGLYPPMYGTQNTLGTAAASTLDVNVSGLPVVLDPNAAAGTVIITNGKAATFFEAGPFTASAEDVLHLGTDYAVWGMGAGVALIPLGIVKTTLV